MFVRQKDMYDKQLTNLYQELAQDGRGAKLAAVSFAKFLFCLAASIRALCAFKCISDNGLVDLRGTGGPTTFV